MTEFVSLLAAFGAIFLLGVQLGKNWRRERDPEFEQWKASLRAEIMGDLAPKQLREMAQEMRKVA